MSITVGSHPRILCSAASLTHMSSVACLHQQLHLCVSFASWIPALRQSAAHFPWELEFLVGARVSVGEAAEEHFLACTKRLVGDTAWRYFMVRASALGDMRGSEAYGGCTVAFSDIVLGGQKAYMTSAVLEASLVEIRPHSALRLMSAYALLSGQSASFTTCHKKRVHPPWKSMTPWAILRRSMTSCRRPGMSASSCCSTSLGTTRSTRRCFRRAPFTSLTPPKGALRKRRTLLWAG